MRHTHTIAILAVTALAPAAGAGQLSVAATAPAAHAGNAPVHAVIAVQFDRPVDRTTVSPDSFWAFGRWSGTAVGTLSFADGDHTVVLDPQQPFTPGEWVWVYLSHDLRGADGTFLRQAGYSFHFWTAARPAPLALSIQDTLSTNAGPESSRPYGGIASDLDRDGWLDLTIVNEDTADLRVFMNQADGSGLYHDFLQPSFPVNTQASPSEPADFNRDGFVDICVANIATSSLSILLGNGDGTFGPQQQVTVGSSPRGVAVLDVDGDGDQDIAHTNAGPGNVSLLLNDGNGAFGAPSIFEGGGSGEWALAAADMDEDGILDLVIGARSSQEIIVQRGNGNGTFTLTEEQASGGLVWMLVVGDVNGDGHEDVVTANSTTNNGSVLLGDGTGQLAPPQTYGADPFPLATDVGDLDGDGDLDWILSSFQGDWRIFRNTGAGAFAFLQEVNAPSNASCALMLDRDNDGDLDLALVDEIADVVILARNGATVAAGDVNGDGAVDVQDLTAVVLGWGPCPPAGWCLPDVNRDGVIDVQDLVAIVLLWS
jgi:hypothetical protein